LKKKNLSKKELYPLGIKIRKRKACSEPLLRRSRPSNNMSNRRVNTGGNGKQYILDFRKERTEQGKKSLEKPGKEQSYMAGAQRVRTLRPRRRKGGR